MVQPPKPPDAEKPETIIFSSFAGLINTVGTERLDANELAAAINVDVDDRGQLRRRRGYTKKLTGKCHSLFSTTDRTVYAVIDNNLCRVHSDYSTEVLLAGLTSDPSTGAYPLSYVEVGNTVYFSSLQDSGKIVDGVVKPWGAQTDAGLWLSPVVSPTPTLAAVRGKLLTKPPMATCMAYFNGRIYMGCGRQVWATELYLYDYVDRTRTFWTFESDVTLVGAVSDGVYVGTADGLWFVTGPSYDKMKRTRVMDSAVIPGSMVDIPAELANPSQVPIDADTPVKVSIAFLTENGFCVAQDSGVATNLTEAKFIFPFFERASALFRRQDGVNQYLVVGDSGGTPVSNARIGDYVDATIIRNGVVVA